MSASRCEAAIGRRYGSSGLLGRLFAPKIDRLLFAVSKADHVAPSQHPALKQLLELMIQPAARAPRFKGITVDVMTLAALRCTDVVRTEHHGQVLSCVRGLLKEDRRETVLFPGEIPPDLPEPEDWASGRFRFRPASPLRIRGSWGPRARQVGLPRGTHKELTCPKPSSSPRPARPSVGP